MLLPGRREGGREGGRDRGEEGGREDVDVRRECQTGWLIRRKEGCYVGVGVVAVQPFQYASAGGEVYGKMQASVIIITALLNLLCVLSMIQNAGSQRCFGSSVSLPPPLPPPLSLLSLSLLKIQCLPTLHIIYFVTLSVFYIYI